MYFHQDDKPHQDAKPCPSKEEIQLRVSSQDIDYFIAIKNMWPTYRGVQYDTDSDGDGAEARILFWFTDHDLYVMVVGVYSSHGDTTYDEVYFVRPKAVTITEYEKV